MRTFVARHPAVSLLLLGFALGLALGALLGAIGVGFVIRTIAVALVGLILGWNWDRIRSDLARPKGTR